MVVAVRERKVWSNWICWKAIANVLASLLAKFWKEKKALKKQKIPDALNSQKGRMW